MMKRAFHPLVVLDIGHTKVSCGIARFNPLKKGQGEMPLRLVGLGTHTCRGLKGGRIVDAHSLQEAVLSAVNIAEKQADLVAREVVIGISAGIQSLHSSVEIALGGKEVTAEDVTCILEAAREKLKARGLKGVEILHAFPTGYVVDGATGVKDPTGMYAERLGVSLHLIVAPLTLMRSLGLLLARAHLSLVGVAAAPYVAGLSTLLEDERDLGVTHIEFGGGLTSLAAYANGQCVHVDVLPIGAHHITQDVSQALGIPLTQAERLKALYGSLLSAPSDDRETVAVAREGGEGAIQVTRGALNRIIRPRAEEILELVKQKLTLFPGPKSATRRIVQTGGGCQLLGMRDLSAAFLDRPVRLGKPGHIRGLAEGSTSPGFAVCAGLLNFYGGKILNGEKPRAEESWWRRFLSPLKGNGK